MPTQATNYSMMDKLNMSLQTKVAAFQTTYEDELEAKKNTINLFHGALMQ